MPKGVYERTAETCKKMSESKKGVKHSDDHRRKVSEASKGRKLSAETKRRMSEAKKGIKLSDEHRKRISESLKGRKFSEEAKKNMSLFLKGNVPWNTGKKWSNKTKKKISETLKGTKLSVETKKKISEAHKGEKHPMYGKHHSIEAREKISRAQRFEDYTIIPQTKGYHKIKLPGGWMLLHRWLGEKIIGRPLREDEVVHHKNEDKGDNRKENLQVMTRGEHTRLHQAKTKKGERKIA